MGKAANYRKRARKVRRYGMLYIVVVQFVAVVAAVVTLLWLGPDWWDLVLHYMQWGWRISPVWHGC